MENALTGVCVTQDTKILYCNRRFTEMFGFSEEELQGMEISRLLHLPSPQEMEYESEIDQATAADVPWLREVTASTKHGSSIRVRHTVNHLQYENKRMAIWHVLDITGQKAIEDTLRGSESQLRLLSEQVLQTQEVERKRVASELHDGIGQILSSIGFNLESTYREIYDNPSVDALSRLAGTAASIRAAIEEVRRISMGLRPAMLDDLGIEPTVEWLCREFQLVHPSVNIIKRIDLRQIDVGNTLRVAIFRILQEAFNNIAKHANATRVDVSLKARRGEVELFVKDNGCGFSIDGPSKPRRGFGLYSMQQRAALSGGRLELHSTAGKGTHIEVRWSSAAAADRCAEKLYRHVPESTDPGARMLRDRFG